MQIDINEAGLERLIGKKNSSTSGPNNFINSKISQMTYEKQKLSNKKKKIEDMEDTFYALILKNGAKCLAMNANIDTEPEANEHSMLCAEDVTEF